MENKMFDMSVYSKEDGYIYIEQSAGGFEDSDLIKIHPEQVDILIKWLINAKNEIANENEESKNQCDNIKIKCGVNL